MSCSVSRGDSCWTPKIPTPWGKAQHTYHKVDGAKTNTPPKSNTYKRPPNYQHSIALNCSPWKRSARAHGVMGLGVISGAISYQPPLPSWRVGNGLHSTSDRFKLWSAKDFMLWAPPSWNSLLSLSKIKILIGWLWTWEVHNVTYMRLLVAKPPYNMYSYVWNFG